MKMWKLNKAKALALFVMILLAEKNFAQEVVGDFTFNPLLSLKYHQVKNFNLKLSAVNDTVALPFLDDFSKENIYPDASLWVDSNAFVNRDYPIAPPTLGVATLDGVSKTGCPYDTSLIGNGSFPADTLTSKPIDLSGLPADSTVVLSFYWQAKGRGNDPEPSDSLLLQFKNPALPDSTGWSTVWFRKGYNPSATDTSFKLALIPVANATYLQNGFQFRFVSYATVNGNVDHWHIDYVYLDKNRSMTDTVLKDVAFAYNSRSLLKNYYSMPWQQYVSSETKSNIFLFIRNNDTVVNNTAFNYSLTALNGGNQATYSGGSDNISPFVTSGYDNHALLSNPCVGSQVPPAPCTPYTFPSLSQDTSFLLQCIISPSSDMNKWNDTLRFTQTFSNYYAYDDGTAEGSYGLVACQGFPGEIAYKFTLNPSKPDSLFALMMLFNWVPQTFGGPSSVNQQPFKIRVWDDNGGKPGNIIHESALTNPNYQYVNHSDWGNLTNLFYPYVLSSKVNVNGTFYVGIVQYVNPCSTLINIGLDKNSNSSSKMYYNIGNGWTQSTVNGSLMIRPVLGSMKGILTVPEKENLPKYFTLHPNPSNGIFLLQTENFKPEKLEVFNLFGEVVSSVHAFTDPLFQIDISGNPPGIYFIRITDEYNMIHFQKIMLTR